MDVIPKITWRQNLLILLTVCFAIYIDLLQTLPLAFSQQVSTQFNLSLAEFDHIVNAFEMPFIFLLLFFGFIVDLLSAKKSILLALIIFVITNYLFSHATDTYTLLTTRFTMGIGGLLATVSILVLLAQQLPKRIFGVVVGLLLAISTLSKFFGIDIHLFIYQNAWVQSANALSLIGIVLLILFLLVPRAKSESSRVRPNIDDIATTLTNRNIWLTGLIATCGYLFVYLFLSMIGPGFLASISHFKEVEITDIFNYGVFSLTAGLLLVAKLGYFITDHRKLIQYCYIIAAISFIFSLFFIQNHMLDIILLCITSFAAASYVLTYAIINANSQRLCLGTAFSIIFILIYLGSALSDNVLQVTANMLNTDVTSHWWLILSIIPILFIIGIILTTLLKPTHIPTSSTTPLSTQFIAFWTRGGTVGRAFWLISVLGNLFVGNLVLTLTTPFGWNAMALSQGSRLVYLCFAVVCVARAHTPPNSWRGWKATALLLVLFLMLMNLVGWLQHSGLVDIAALLNKV